MDSPVTLSNRFSFLSSFCEVCDLHLCDCSSHFNETAIIPSVTQNYDMNTSDNSFSESVNMVAAQLQDTQYTCDDLHNSDSMRPTLSDNDNTLLSSDSNLINDTCVRSLSFSYAENLAINQTPSEQEGSIYSTCNTLSTCSDQSSSIYSSQPLDNITSTQHDMSNECYSV